MQAPKSPRVTVLMTAHNGLPYLPHAIDSVLRQTFSDFEFLTIDDASTDGSADCIRSYPDPRIRLVCNPKNVGQAKALNQGLALARGEYVARLDQDDLCRPDRLQRQVDFLDAQSDPAGVGSWHDCIGADGRRIRLEPGASDLPQGGFGTLIGLLLTQATPVGHPTVMYRRRIIAEAGGYDHNFAPSEDYALWTRLALARYSLGMIPEALVMVRIHPRQQSAEKLLLQRMKTAQAHQQLVAAFCTFQEKPQEIGCLLRMDEEIWKMFPSSSQIRGALQALHRFMENLRRSLNLSPEEYVRFSYRLYWWMARGALLGVLHKQRQSVHIVLFLLRRDIRVLRFPSVWAYPTGLLLSPLLGASFHRWLAPWIRMARRQRGFFRRVLHPVHAPDRELSRIPL